MGQLETTEFKAKFDAILKKIESTGEPVLVTKNGRPHVKVILYQNADQSVPAPGRPRQRRRKRDGR